jgi:hypothetical protein
MNVYTYYYYYDIIWLLPSFCTCKRLVNIGVEWSSILPCFSNVHAVCCWVNGPTDVSDVQGDTYNTRAGSFSENILLFFEIINEIESERVL